MKYKIVDIHKYDAYYRDKKYLIGMKGEFEFEDIDLGTEPEFVGFVSGYFTNFSPSVEFSKNFPYSDAENRIAFFAVKLAEIAEEDEQVPENMSEDEWKVVLNQMEKEYGKLVNE